MSPNVEGVNGNGHITWQFLHEFFFHIWCIPLLDLGYIIIYGRAIPVSLSIHFRPLDSPAGERESLLRNCCCKMAVSQVALTTKALSSYLLLLLLISKLFFLPTCCLFNPIPYIKSGRKLYRVRRLGPLCLSCCPFLFDYIFD